MGVASIFGHLMCNLDFGQEGAKYGETQRFHISKGTRQGCVLCLYLFNSYAEHIWEAEEATVKIGTNINNPKYIQSGP